MSVDMNEENIEQLGTDYLVFLDFSSGVFLFYICAWVVLKDNYVNVGEGRE